MLILVALIGFLPSKMHTKGILTKGLLTQCLNKIFYSISFLILSGPRLLSIYILIIDYIKDYII